MIALYVVAAIAVYAAARAILERNTGRRFPYANVLNFAVAGSLVLLLDHPITLVAAAAYFVAPRLRQTPSQAPTPGG